jgi:site-specific recombinase XerD
MEYLQRTEVRNLLKVALEHNPEHHLALLVMYATGTRVSQALELTGAHVYTDETTGVAKIRIPKAKRGLTRSYEIFKSVNPVLDLTPLVALAARRGSAKLFGGLTRQYLHKVLKRYAKLAGLPQDMVHCHIIRHSTATRIWNETHSLGAITGYLCHSSPASAYPYLREHDASIAEKAMRQELEAA